MPKKPLKPSQKFLRMVNLPDDEAILRLFPKRLVDKVNELIGHEPSHRPTKSQDTK